MTKRLGSTSGATLLAAAVLVGGPAALQACGSGGEDGTTPAVASSSSSPTATVSATTPPPIDGGHDATADAFTPTGAPGTPDTSFGGTGVVSRTSAWGDSGTRAAAPHGLVIDSHHRIVIVGEDGAGYHQAAAWRVDETGQFDSTFGMSGEWVNDTAGAVLGLANAVCVDADDRPVLTGEDGTGNGGTVMATWRLTASGSRDATFNGTGSLTRGTPATVPERPRGNAIVCAPNGDILVGGAIDARMAVWRFSSAGVSDTAGFASPAGFIAPPVPSALTGHSAVVSALLLDPAARILVGVDIYTEHDVLRLSGAGAVDPTWASSGTWTAPVDAYSVSALARDAAGRILVAGSIQSNVGYVSRLSPDGAIDASFGTSGRAAIPGALAVAAMTLDSKGRIVIGGQSGTGASAQIGVARLTEDGAPDLAFGAAGAAVTQDLGMGYFPARALAVDRFDRPVLATKSADGIRVARFNP